MFTLKSAAVGRPMSLAQPSHCGYLIFEEVPGSDVFVRRFFVLDRTNARLEYYADANLWVVACLVADLNTFKLAASSVPMLPILP